MVFSGAIDDVVSGVVGGGGVVTFADVTAILTVVSIVDVGLSFSRRFSEEVPVPLIGASMQHRMLVGHCTCSRTSKHIKVANACTHTPGQSALLAVLVMESSKPMNIPELNCYPNSIASARLFNYA